MIPLTTTLCQERNRKSGTWQQELANAIRDPEELLSLVGLKPDQIPGEILTGGDFPLRVPRGYAARIKPGNPHDPLLLQVLSRSVENTDQPGFQIDPVGDGPATALPGLLHKYHGRVLLITTAACPIHCRYCFRRHFPYSENRIDNKDWTRAIEYIEADSSIREVILSGGDPLSLTTNRLRNISRQLVHIPHVTRLRIHTRMPIALPERINDKLLNWLGELPWKIALVVHCNHSQELDSGVIDALSRLGSTGTILLNQAVLLKDINDNVAAQADLSEALFSAGVLPYYLHLLDRVVGAAHFEVRESVALKLLQELQGRLPGFLVPKLVKEVSGLPHKMPV